jgi:hypothetical protein
MYLSLRGTKQSSHKIESSEAVMLRHQPHNQVSAFGGTLRFGVPKAHNFFICVFFFVFMAYKKFSISDANHFSKEGISLFKYPVNLENVEFLSIETEF